MSSVRIPIDADATSAVRAVNDLKAALAGVGVEGKIVAGIDLSKMGARELNAELDRVRENLQDLVKVGIGATAAGARKAFGANPLISDLFTLNEHAARLYPDASARARFVSSVSNYALRGTAFDPANQLPPIDIPPPPAPPDPPPPPPRPNEGGFGGSIKTGLAAGGGFLLAQAGISSVRAAAGDALYAGQDSNAATDGLLRRVGDLTTSFDQLDRSAKYFQQGLLITQTNLERYAQVFATAAGHGTGGDALRNARLASGLGSSYGVDAGGFASAMGQASFLSMDPARFAEMIADTVGRGNMGGRVEEVLGAILHWTESASRYSATGGALTANVAGFDALYTSMQKSGNPMFAGANGAAVIDQINNSIMGGGGGGLAGQVLVQRAMMGAGFRDPYSIDMQLKKGAFAQIGDSGRTNYDVIMGELGHEYSGLDRDGTRMAEAGGTLLGLNPNVVQSLLKLKVSGSNIDAVNKSLAASGHSISDINPSSLADIFKAQTADAGTLADMAVQASHMKGLSQANADRLGNLDGKDPEKTRQAIIQALAETGMPQTDQTRTLDAEAALTDALVSLGKTLNAVVIPLKETIAHLIEKAAPLFDWATRQLGGAETQPNNDGMVVLSNPNYTAGGTGFRGRAPTFNKQVALPQNIDVHSGLLSRIGQKESQLGVTSPNVFGLMNASWLKNIKEMAASDPTIAAQIAGKSDDEIDALRDLPHWQLQQSVAAHLLGKIPGSDKRRYAYWNLGADGDKVLAAKPDVLLDNLLSKSTMANAANYKAFHGHTAGWYRDTFTSMFPGDGPAPDVGAPGSAGTGTVNARVAGAITVIIKDAKQRVHDTQRVPITQGDYGTPSPAGAH